MASDLLTGLRVLDLGDFFSAPLCARLLGDLGADVIKVEPSTGDSSRRAGPFPGDQPDPEASGLFCYLNAGKRSITLDWRTATGRDILLRLVAEADIVVENQHPGHLDEAGLTYQVMAERNPGLVLTSITPYGRQSPISHWKGYDINVNAIGGMTVAIGSEEREPLNPPEFQASFQGAIQGAVATMMAALIGRVTGRGQHVDLSTAEGIATMHMGSNIVSYIFSGRLRRRGGHRVRTRYPYTTLPCKDGHVSMIALQAREWSRIVAMLGNPEWASQPRYQDRSRMGAEYPEEVDALIEPWLMARTKAEVFAAAREHRVPVVPVQTAEEVFNDQHLRARNLFQPLIGPNGPVGEAPGFPAFIDEERPHLGTAPALGQHTQEILVDRLGYTADEVVKLYATGII
jgi:crotonobetainyl-CoA:carnitine CoA-transferase CaiB-like acyl-CoA transferase